MSTIYDTNTKQRQYCALLDLVQNIYGAAKLKL